MIKAVVILGLLLGASLYINMGFYEDKVHAELRAINAERALKNSVSDTNATKVSYKLALEKIDKIRKEAEREKCKLKTLTGGNFTIDL